MKASELKQAIKPLIKECLKEILVEEGFTKMLSEAAASQPIATQQIKQATKQSIQENVAQKQALREMQQERKKVLDSIGKGGFDAFAGTEPLREDKEIKGADPGVDINSLMGNNKQVWKQMLDGMSSKKK